MQPPNRSLRQRAQQSAILCDRQRLGALGSQCPLSTQAPTPPPGTAVGFGAAWLREEGWSNGAGGGRRAVSAEEIPLRSKANQYRPRPERFKKPSYSSPLPVIGKQVAGRAVWTLLGRSIVSSGRSAWGESLSLRGGLRWASCLWGSGNTRASTGPVLGFSHPSPRRDLGGLLRALPSISQRQGH